MAVTVEIKTGSRTVISYLLSPLVGTHMDDFSRCWLDGGEHGHGARAERGTSITARLCRA